MFIRIKKIKGLEYAYLVKSVWKDKTARQKVVQYLGKVYMLSKTNDALFETFCKEENKNIENADLKAIIQVLMEWTLSQQGFTKDPQLSRLPKLGVATPDSNIGNKSGCIGET